MASDDMPTTSEHKARQDLLGRLDDAPRNKFAREALTTLLLRPQRDGDTLTLRPHGSYLTPIITERVKGSFLRAAAVGSTTLMQSYSRGEWDTIDLYQLLNTLWRQEQILRKIRAAAVPIDMLRLVIPRRADYDYRQIALHYDLPLTIFEAYLGPGLPYSATKMRNHPEDNYAACCDTYQEILASLHIRRSDKAVVLDLGAGWGALTGYVLEQTTCSVYALTISPSQAIYLRRHFSNYIPQRLTITEGNFMDPATLPQNVDAIIMIESIEHIHPRDRARLLKLLGQLYPDAPLFLQFTGTPGWTYLQKKGKVTAGNSIIFPGPGELPHIGRTIRLARQAGYRVDHIDDLTAEYCAVALVWRSRFKQHVARQSALYPAELIRAWDFFLTGFATALSQRALTSHQLTLTRR